MALGNTYFTVMRKEGNCKIQEPTTWYFVTCDTAEATAVLKTAISKYISRYSVKICNRCGIFSSILLTLYDAASNVYDIH